MAPRYWPALAVALLVVLVNGCSNTEDNPSFDLCGNGTLDGQEQCDDGDVAVTQPDNDGCLSSCQLATCGDEFVYVGVEECDGRNLDPVAGNFNQPFGCANLGLGEGTLRCDAGCRFDTSACGPAFTPTPTATATVTFTATQTGQVSSTPTPTSTFTPTPDPECGNGDIDAGETCDDGNTSDDDACPSDCRILPCTPLATTRAVQVDFASPPFQDASSITVLLSYPDGIVSLPGVLDEPTVGQRITMRQSLAQVSLNDLDHALRVVYSRPGRINSARIFVATFDECAGADQPPIDAFTCRVTDCANSSGPLVGCSCTVSEEAQ